MILRTLLRASITVMTLLVCHILPAYGAEPNPQAWIGFDEYICTFLDGNMAYLAANPSSNLTGDLIAGAAIDQARFFETAYKKVPKAEFAKFQEAYQKNADQLATLAKKSFRDGATVPEREAVGQVRRALYIDTAVALISASRAAKPGNFQTVFRNHEKALAVIAVKNWHTETLSEDDEARVCDVMKAYSKK